MGKKAPRCSWGNVGGAGVGPTPRSTVSGLDDDGLDSRPSLLDGAFVVVGSSSRVGDARRDDLDLDLDLDLEDVSGMKGKVNCG